MMGTRQKAKTGDEWDLLYWRHAFRYIERSASTIKKRMRRRIRHEGKQLCK